MEYALIAQNTAPVGAALVDVADASGARVGVIPLGHLALPARKPKLYTMGCISDIHLQQNTAQDDFKAALIYFAKEKVNLVCVCGDLTQNGQPHELKVYRDFVEEYSDGIPVYAITGNHEGVTGIADIIEEYTGHPLYFSFEHRGDVFIMVGVKGATSGNLFTKAELQWLYETLEANRNRRCFVFQHVRPQDGCGNAFGIYAHDIWGGTEAEVFESLMRHYHNVVLFHGHSHLKFYLQYGSDIANIDRLFGCWSVHIPSLAVPRDGDPSGAASRKEVYADSEGYLVDVYPNGIHLRGRDFIKGEFLPIASYWLDTTPVEFEAGTYTDPTGTIST